MDYATEQRPGAGTGIAIQGAGCNAPDPPDYQQTNGTLTFAVAPATTVTADLTPRTVRVQTCSDGDVEEGEETFLLRLSNPDPARPDAEKATLSPAFTHGTITDDSCIQVTTDGEGDPPPPEITLGYPNWVTKDDEGNPRVGESRRFEYEYTVTLGTPFCESQALEVSLVEGTARPTTGISSLSAGAFSFDFIAPNALTLPFNANEATSSGSVTIFNDPLDELDETFTMQLRWPSAMGAAYGGVAVDVPVVIVDDDTAAISVANDSADEGETLEFTVKSDIPTAHNIQVTYHTLDLATGPDNEIADGGSCGASPPDDYEEETGATVTIPADNTVDAIPTAPIEVDACPDNVDEDPERFRVVLSDAAYAGGPDDDKPDWTDQGAAGTILDIEGCFVPSAPNVWDESWPELRIVHDPSDAPLPVGEGEIVTVTVEIDREFCSDQDFWAVARGLPAPSSVPCPREWKYIYLIRTLVRVCRGGDVPAIDRALTHANAGSDFVAFRKAVTFEAGVTEVEVPVTIVSDRRGIPLDEADELFVFEVAWLIDGDPLGGAEPATYSGRDSHHLEIDDGTVEVSISPAEESGYEASIQDRDIDYITFTISIDRVSWSDITGTAEFVPLDEPYAATRDDVELYLQWRIPAGAQETTKEIRADLDGQRSPDNGQTYPGRNEGIRDIDDPGFGIERFGVSFPDAYHTERFYSPRFYNGQEVPAIDLLDTVQYAAASVVPQTVIGIIHDVPCTPVHGRMPGDPQGEVVLTFTGSEPDAAGNQRVPEGDTFGYELDLNPRICERGTGNSTAVVFSQTFVGPLSGTAWQWDEPDTDPESPGITLVRTAPDTTGLSRTVITSDVYPLGHTFHSYYDFARDLGRFRGRVFAYDDPIDENDETLTYRFVWQSQLAGAYTGQVDTVTVVIEDDDTATVSVADASGDEGGTVDFAFTLDRLSQRPIVVSYRTIPDAAATAAHATVGDCTGTEGGDDYEAKSGRVTIAPNVTYGETPTARISVVACWDHEIEGPETFEIEITDAVYADANPADPADRPILGDTRARGTIGACIGRLEDHPPPELVLHRPIAARERDGVVEVVVEPQPRPCPGVRWAIEARTVNGRAVGKRAGSLEDPRDDYEHWGDPLTGSWRSGDSSGYSTTLPVRIIDDDLLEGDEEFRFRVRWHQTSDLVPVSYRNSRGSAAQVTIEDDVARLNVVNARAREGQPLTFTVRLTDPGDPGDPASDVPTPLEITVDWRTIDGFGSGTAEPSDPRFPDFPGDYERGSGTLTFAPWSWDDSSGEWVLVPGETEKTITVVTNDEGFAGGEPETVLLEFTRPVNVELPVAPHGVGTIIEAGTCVNPDTDTATDLIPRILANTDPERVTEGTGNEFGGIRVDLDLPLCANRANVLQWRTVDGSATAGQDYTTSSGDVPASANRTGLTLGEVPIIDDVLDEDDEDVYVVVGWHEDMPQRYRDAGEVTFRAGVIGDDDPLPKLTLANAEGEEGETLEFVVRLTNESGQPVASGRTVSVSYATGPQLGSGDAGADSNSDYDPLTSATLTFDPGEMVKTVSVMTNTDEEVEGDNGDGEERFVLKFSVPHNADFLNREHAVGTIRDPPSSS